MKISGVQIFWLMFSLLTGNMMLKTIGPAIREAKQDAWISFLLASILGIIIVFIATKVSLLYPDQTLIEYSKTILGKWLGNVVVISYLIHWYLVLGPMLRGFVDFTITILMHSTPLWVLILTMLLLMIYVNYFGGIEGIARCSEVFGPIVVLMLIGLFLLTISNLDYQHLLPIFSDFGFRPILNGTIPPLTFFGESVMIMMFVSFMDQPKNGPSRAMWGVFLSAICLMMAIISVLMMFGPEIAAKLRFPAIEAIRFINIMGFIQNLEILAVLVWLLSVFIKLSLYLFLASYGTAQWLKIKDWRNVMWFVAVLSFILAIISPNATQSDYLYIEKFMVPYILPINMIGIPLLLWIVGSIRKKKKVTLDLRETGNN